MSKVSVDQNTERIKSTICNVQILRSSSSWSAGIENTENSIMKTYCNLIKSSTKFIFIENQFFVTSAGKSTTGGALVSDNFFPSYLGNIYQVKLMQLFRIKSDDVLQNELYKHTIKMKILKSILLYQVFQGSTES